MKGLKLLVLFVTIFFTGVTSFYAQTLDPELQEVLDRNDEKEMLAVATSFTIEGMMFRAEPFVDKLLVIDASNPQYNYLKGIIELYYRQDHQNALVHFDKSVIKVEGRLDLLKPDTDVSNDVFYHRGHAYHFLGDIENAEKNYSTFKENSRKMSFLVKEVDIRLEQIEVAKKLMNQPKDVTVEPLEAVNTDAPEYSPVVSANGRELYFTTRRQWENMDQDRYRNRFDNTYPEDIYFTLNDRRDGFNGGEILPLCKGLVNEASVSLTPNMAQLFIYSDSLGNGNIFYTDYTLSEFKRFDELGNDEVNSDYWETHFTITPDSSLIIFSSHRKSGYGGRDLYYMTREDDGSWSDAVNMGANVNSAGEEDSPVLLLDGNTLYYATNGPASMGGFDIMKSTFENGAWSVGENVGAPINSTGDDIFFSPVYNGTQAYFTSFRVGGEGEKDIYLATFPNEDNGADIIALEGGMINITDNAEEIDLGVQLRNLTTNKDESVFLKHNDFFNILEDCNEYELTYTNITTGEVLSQETFKTNCNKETEYLDKYYYNGNYILSGIVTNDSTGEVIPNALIEIYDNRAEEVIGSVTTDANGTYTFDELDGYIPGDLLSLELRASATDYKDESWALEQTLDYTGEITYNETLAPDDYSRIEELLASYIIYYDFDRSNIRNSEEETLDKVIALMKEYPSLKIELSSHTDCRGSNSYNQSLSDRRAASAKKYIAERIDNPDRISGKGFGETQLTNDCDCTKACSKANHELNRRTEFKVVK